MSRFFLDLTPPEGFRSWRQYAVHASGPRIPGPLSLIQMNQFADQFGDYIIEFRLPRPYPRRLAQDAAAVLRGIGRTKTDLNPPTTEVRRPVPFDTGRIPAQPTPMIGRTPPREEGYEFFEADYSQLEPVVPGVNDWWKR